MLPETITHLSGFASLNKEYLKPHDTIDVIARAGSHFHGTVALTFASPTPSPPVYDSFIITGTKGWLSVNQVTVAGVPVLRVIIKSVSSMDSKSNKEIEEIIEEPVKGVQVELGSFFNVISGKLEESALGEPLGALRDVSFIQAALNSGGNLVDLADLVPESL